MECSCEIEIDTDCGGSGFENRKEVTARKNHKCHECGEAINQGDKYESASGVHDGYFYHHKTCADCLSLRDQVFTAGWWYGQIWDDFFSNIGCSISETCIAALTPKAREKVCEHIEDCWSGDDAEKLADEMVSKLEKMEIEASGEYEEPRTCLNCLYEPKWTEFKHGVCGWPIDEKLPHGVVWTKRAAILKRYPHKNCPAWRPKV